MTIFAKYSIINAIKQNGEIMISVNNVRLQFGGRVLFDEVNLKFSKGNCYGIIGANGAGKSTFLKLLSGQIEPSSGDIVIDKGERMSVLAQNQNAYDQLSVLDTVLGGYGRLVEVMHQRDMLYAKENFTDEDGVLAGELENEFLEMGGWEAEGEAQTLLQDLGINPEFFDCLMADMEPKQKVKVLLARALFKYPDILVLDEPTNNLDAKTVNWLENYLLDFPNTVIVVSHNRYFLNKICTHICDVDYGKINMYVGNYDFWYETSQLLARQAKEQNKKAEQRAKELQDFIARFSANASKSKQATSRKKELEKLTFVDIKPSSRKYPYIDFRPDREIGNEVLRVTGLTKIGHFENVSFVVNRDDKIAFLSDKANDITMLFKILVGEETAESGTINWGNTVKISYLPENNEKYFANCDLNLVDWLSQFSKEKDVTYLRSWLGRMLFTGEEGMKQAKVLSGGERVRCMMAKAMLTAGNVLILDEPTNHLDLESITALNKGMINYKSPMLFTSQDHEILQTVANRIIVINGKKTFDKQCTYNEYLGID